METATNEAAIYMLPKKFDMFDTYLQMLVSTEAPLTFHRWSLMTTIGALLGRKCWIQFGSNRIHPNMYVMLMGGAGSRKSTAIKDSVKLLKLTGYNTIAAEKTSKEKFLLDLSSEDDVMVSDDLLDTKLFDSEGSPDAEILIAADEFNVFLGNGNLEFLALLGTLWDYDGKFENKTKNSKSAYIYNPTVTILAGNTSVSFNNAFPIETIGQGIFSRLLLIQGEKTTTKITIPPKHNMECTAKLLEHMKNIKSTMMGEISISKDAFHILDTIYKSDYGLIDIRFESYNNRRLTHLLKLCIILTAIELKLELTPDTLIKANTILTHAEHSMPKALGEFGASKHSDISNKLMSILNDSRPPVVPFKVLWKQLYTDLESPDQLKAMLSSLEFAEKIMATENGFISKQAAARTNIKYVDFNLLTEEEYKGVIL